MSYEEIDKSVETGAPIEFYIFSVENLRFYYTNATRDFMQSGNLFLSRSIERTALTNNMSIIDNSDTKITLPRSDLLSQKCAGMFTPSIINVEIFQRHRSDPDGEAKRIFSGYLLDIETNGRMAEFSFTTLMRSYVDGQVATVSYTAVCNHDWGDSRCRVDIEAYSRASQVVSSDLWTLTVAGFVGEDMKDFIGGFIRNDRTNVQRNVVDIDQNRIFLDGMFADVEVGDTIKIYPGCDHLIDSDCRTAFNNVINFGGFPFIPRSNPFLKGFGEIDYSFTETPH